MDSRADGTNGARSSLSQERGAPVAEVRFGPYVLYPRSRELHKNGRRVRIAEKPFLVLASLLERPGEVVLREELRRRLWTDDTFVDFDNNLNTAVASLRQLLSDSARAPKLIETLPRVGYRFIGHLEPAAASQPAPSAFESATRASHARPRLHPRVWAALGAVTLVAVSIWMGAGTAPRSSSPTLPVSHSLAVADGIYLLERGDAGGLMRAAALLERATEEDSEHAAAHAALGEARLRMALRGLAAASWAFAAAESAARRALHLDPGLAAPHRTLARLHLHRDWDFDASDRASARAVETDPSDPKNHLVLATIYAARGRFDAAIAAAHRAIALDPGNMRVRTDLAYFLLAAGRLEAASDESQRVLSFDPDLAAALDFLLTSNERLGRFGEARMAALRLMELARAPEPEVRAVQQAEAAEAVRRYHAWQVRYLEENATSRAWPAMTVASIYASAGDADKAFEWLERAFESRDSMLALLVSNPDLAPVRHDPRFAALARRLGLPAA